MKLNLPILHLLEKSQNILIAGAGGGFDVFAGLPLYFTLREHGKRVHLANYSFMDFDLAQHMGEIESLIDMLLIGAKGKLKFPAQYYPEGALADWFVQQGEDVTVWMFNRTGAKTLHAAYDHLVRHLGIDALILVDGGVDSLMRGDETAPGTLIEDTISLCAVEKLDIPVKLQVCLGFGTEVEEGVCHHHALENMAALIKAGAFYGACALTPQMPAFQRYEAACRHAWEHPADAQKSHISTRIIPAVRGEFGDYHMYPDDNHVGVFISPLMGIYWFFDANIVLKHNRMAQVMRDTLTADEARSVGMRFYMGNRKRPKQVIPY